MTRGLSGATQLLVAAALLAACTSRTASGTQGDAAETPASEAFAASLGVVGAAITRSGERAVASVAGSAGAEAARYVGERAVDVVVPEGARVMPCGQAPPGMRCIEGGWFVRGIDVDEHVCDQSGQPDGGRSSSTPSSLVWVSTFYMDETEVTNRAWEACVEAGACEPAGALYVDFDAPEQPITAVSWYEASAYCRAMGRRLPTEAEFEKAARGTDGARQPYGDDVVTCDVAIIRDERGRSCGDPMRSHRPEIGHVMPVRSRPAGRYGLYDIAGNTEEWVADWWTADWDDCGDACAGVDPRGPCAGDESCDGFNRRVVRGGSWYWPGEHATGWHRRPARPRNDPPHHFGFRCAVSAEDVEGAMSPAWEP